MPMVDGFQHAELFAQLGLRSPYRIAWVEFNSQARNATEFVETVLTNRGFEARVFDSEPDAMAWLFGSQTDQ